MVPIRWPRDVEEHDRAALHRLSPGDEEQPARAAEREHEGLALGEGDTAVPFVERAVEVARSIRGDGGQRCPRTRRQGEHRKGQHGLRPLDRREIHRDRAGAFARGRGRRLEAERPHGGHGTAGVFPQAGVDPLLDEGHRVGRHTVALGGIRSPSSGAVITSMSRLPPDRPAITIWPPPAPFMTPA